MALRFTNTLTRKLEEFVPKVPGEVGLYTCGPTVHDFAHIGNFRTYVFEDLLRRYLKYRGYRVTQVMNLTDVEDKIIRRSQEAGMSMSDYTARFIAAFFEDLKRLNIEPVEFYPRATECVDEMAEMIRDLMKKGIGYKSEDGSVYYDITKFPEYGRLACINVEELQAGARVCQDEYEKEHASDFALWKAWTEGDGPVFWDNYPDLGKGRPGWHIECSAMSLIHLGKSFDIHCGGVDNIFPHHQNEIAQSEAYSGQTFVNYWLHSEHLQVEHEKMSKSLGNFFTVRDLIDPERNQAHRAHDPMVIRYALLSVPYRSRLNFRFEGLVQAEKALERINDFLRRCQELAGPGAADPERIQAARRAFCDALDDDLNIAEALARLFELITDVNKALDEKPDPVLASASLALFYELDAVLGLELEKRAAGEELDPESQSMLEAREVARKEKQWKTADQMRDSLLARGIVIEDTPQGTRWKRMTPPAK
jgi:cysteinyl-tRNA synthetase